VGLVGVRVFGRDEAICLNRQLASYCYTYYTYDIALFFFFFFFLDPKLSLTANTHTHRTSTQHTHKKHRPCLGVGITIRYRRPLRCRALDCPGSAAGVERRAKGMSLEGLTRDIPLVEPSIWKLG